MGLVPHTEAPFSFEMDVVVALFLVCISLHPLIFMYVHMLMCVYPCVCGGGGGLGVALFVLVCVQVLMVRVSSNKSVHRVRKYTSHLSDQSQGRGVGDGGMRTVDCREEQKWLPISSP